MKIKITNIDVGKFVIREKFDEKHVEEILESFKVDGQWNPIIVRSIGDGRYELIAGHYRLQAAKELGWEEIEALVKDLADVDASFLSLKTNIMHSDMTAREQGLVLQKIVEKYKLSGSEVARRLNVSETWVNKRIRLTLNLHETVITALEKNEINFDVASIIGSVDSTQQPMLLEIIIARKISKPTDATKLKNKFLNDTIYTIGYQERNSSEFIKILKNNKVDVLIDVRFSAKSERKPEFNKDILKRELERSNIKYRHYPELGIPYNIQTPYKEGKFSIDCLKQWYSWHIESEVEFDNIIKYLKDTGRPVLMCMERYAKKMRTQKYNCHRDILANMILKYTTLDPLLKFEKRIDL